jgi:hypothetical protein
MGLVTAMNYSLKPRSGRGGARSGAGQPPFKPTKAQRRMVSILGGVGRPHKEIATLVVNPRTGRAIDDVTPRLLSRRIVPGQGQGFAHPWDLARGQGQGRGQRRAWDAGSQSLGLGSAGVSTMALPVPQDVLDENGEAKIIIELVKAPKRDVNSDFIE